MTAFGLETMKSFGEGAVTKIDRTQKHIRVTFSIGKNPSFSQVHLSKDFENVELTG